MNNLLVLFLSLSLSGSVLALLLFALRPLTRRHLSKSWQYYIWLVVLLRFLLPISPQHSVVGELTRSLQSAAAMESAEQPVLPETDDSPTIGNELPPADSVDYLEPARQTDDLPPIAQPAGVWQGVLSYVWVVWLGGALILIAYKTATYRSFARFARAGAVEVSRGRLHDLYQDELAIGNIRRPLPLYVNDLISSPMLVGLLRPVIILPTLNAGDSELRHILRHELTHYKRLDSLYKWLAQLVLCLHWFNPLVYRIVRELGRACELACDEAVVKRMDADSRMSYGDALLASLKAQGSYSSSVISLTMSEDAGTIKERLDAIVGYRGKSAWTRVTASMLTVLFFCGFAFTGAYRTATAASPYKDDPAGTAAGEGISGDSASRTPRGTSRAPEDVGTVTVRAGGPVAPQARVEIVIADNAAVNLVPTSADEISVDYGDTLYEVSIEPKNEEWRIRISYTGSYSAYPAAVLYLPDVVYRNVDLYADQATIYFDGVFRGDSAVKAHMEDCSVFYTIPAGFAGTLDATAPDSYFQLHSEDDYQNCDIAIANCASFGNIVDGFSQQNGSLTYRHGTGAGTVRVDMAGGGYATIESGRYDSPASAITSTDTNADGLTLVEGEYTISELREQNIWGVKLNVASEDVSVSTGGQTLKLQYYQSSDSDYTLETVSDRGGTIQELYLLRNASTLDDTPRSIHITIPEGFDCDVLHLTTGGGNITLDDFRANTVMLQTQGGNGDIWLNGGAVEGSFSATTADGGINITGTALPPGEFSNNLRTESGTVRLSLPGSISGYAFKIDTGSGARIQIGGESYSGGSAYTVNSGGMAGTIKFTSESGVLLVEEP